MDETPWGHAPPAVPPPAPPPAHLPLPPAPAHPANFANPANLAGPTKKKGMSTGAIVALIVGGLVLLLAVVIAFSGFALVVGQSAVEATVPRDALVGQCFNADTGLREPVSCDSPHHFEVYSLIEFFPGEPYPSRLGRLTGSTICQEDFETYTGENFWTSQLDYSIPYPTEEEWNDGDLETLCVLHHAEFDELHRSYADLART